MKAPNKVSLKELAEEMEKRLTTSGRHIHRCRECDDERVELLQLLRERNNLLSCKYYNDKLHTELKSRTHIHPWRRTLFSLDKSEGFNLLLQSLQVQADLNHLLTLHVNAYLDTLIEVYPHVKIETLKMVYKSNREEKTKHGLDLLHDADF